MDLSDWLETYRRVWVDHACDRGVVEALFAPDAIYRPNVLSSIEQPYVGHDEIAGYFDRVTPVCDLEFFRYGRPFVDGDRAAVEIWLYGALEGEHATEALCSTFTFAADGRCRELRDYV